MRYMRSFDGLGLDRFTGNALFVGPTFYAKFSEKAWMSAVSRDRVGGRVVAGLEARSIRLTSSNIARCCNSVTISNRMWATAP